MDQFPIPDWAAQYIPQNYATYTPYIRRTYTLLNTLRTSAHHLISAASLQPDLATLALLIIALFLSLKILNILLQTVMFWLRLARKLAFYGGIAVLALWMWTRGPQGVWEDLGYWVDTWKEERAYWSERERVARVAAGQRGGAGGGAGWWG